MAGSAGIASTAGIVDEMSERTEIAADDMIVWAEAELLTVSGRIELATVAGEGVDGIVSGSLDGDEAIVDLVDDVEDLQVVVVDEAYG